MSAHALHAAMSLKRERGSRVIAALWSVLMLLAPTAVVRSEEEDPFGRRAVGPPARIQGLGVNYGLVADNLPPPERVSQLLQSTALSSVKLYSPDARVLQALAHTGITVVVGVPDEDIPILAASAAAAASWVRSHVAPYHPATDIVALAVGNEVLSKASSRSALAGLLPAMQNLYGALRAGGLAPTISVSTPHSMGVLATSYPPSAATFQPDLLPVLAPLLAFLSRTSAPFMSNAYPYFAYRDNADVISLDYALFRPRAGVADPTTGLLYTNLFDAQVDAIYYAMRAAGFDDIPVVVAESGWPSTGDPNEVGASVSNAQEYNANLVKRIASRKGTPHRPTTPIAAYIFALFNEDLKPGPTSERNFGLYHPDETRVYDVGLHVTSSTLDGPPAPPPPPAATWAAGSNSTWCVAKPSAADASLEQSIQYACEEGGADCTPIQAGGACFRPDTLASHASFAMNSYFQRHGRRSWNCYFGGAGVTTATDPSYGSCIYPYE